MCDVCIALFDYCEQVYVSKGQELDQYKKNTG